MGGTAQPAGLESLLVEAFAATPRPFLVLDADMSVRHANRAFLELFAVEQAGTFGRSFFELGNGQWDIPALRALLGDVLAQAREVRDFRVEHDLERIGARALLLDARRLDGRGVRPDSILVTLEDVTEREALERELAGRHEFTEKLIDSLREAVLVLTRDLRVHAANRPFYELFGVEPEQTLGRHVYELGNGQWDAPELRRLLEGILPREDSFDDYGLDHQLEGIGWRKMVLNARRLDHMPLILLTIRDLTDAALSHSRLRESEARFRVMADSLPMMVWVTNEQADLEFVNRTYQEFFGFRGEVPGGGEWRGLVHPEDAEDHLQLFLACHREERPFHAEVRVRRADGAWRWVESRAWPRFSPDGRFLGMVGASADIEARKQAEAQLALLIETLEQQVGERTAHLREEIHARRRVEDRLRQSEARFRTTFESAPVGMVQASPDGRLRMVNPAFCRLTGYDESELIGRPFSELTHPEDLEDNIEGMGRLIRGEIPVYETLKRYVRKDGTAVWADVKVTVVRDDGGEPLHAIAVAVDVTARKVLEERVARYTEQLAHERDFIERVLESQPVPVLVLDGEGRLVRSNRACEITAGYDLRELHGTTRWLDLIPPEERAGVEEVTARLRSGEDMVRHENHWVRRDGSRRLLSWSNTVLKDRCGGLRCIIGSGVDITDQREAELQARDNLEEAARLQRIQTANELATHIAHELNQPLAAISMFADTGQRLVAASPPDEATLAENLRRIGEQARRAAEIIRRLRSFLGRGRIDPSPMDLNAVIRAAVEMTETRARKDGIRLELDLDETLPPVMAVEVHVQQVLLNLLRNAIEALEESAKDGARVVVETGREDHMVRVTVRDNGPGVGAEAAARLFEPLRSTKDDGLGVGLRISRSLIQAQGGRLWLEPQSPGAVFRFMLPIAP
jgi:PAS domain S-box-containing protein